MIEIDSFVPRDQIDERYLDSPYYIGPNDPVGQEAFAVIREAMRGKGMVALGRVVLAKRERVIMLQPWDKGLMGTTLRYPYEVRDAKDYFYDIPDVKIAPDVLKLAEHILKSKESTFDPSKFVDRYEQAVLQLLEKKQQGMPAPKARPFVAPTNVINLMDALRRSVADDGKRQPGAAPNGDCGLETEEGEEARRGSDGIAVAYSRAKRTGQGGSEARRAADRSTQGRVATISRRHAVIVGNRSPLRSGRRAGIPAQGR